MSGGGQAPEGRGEKAKKHPTILTTKVAPAIGKYLSQLIRGTSSAVWGLLPGTLKKEAKTFGRYCNDGGQRVGEAAIHGIEKMNKRKGLAKISAAIEMGAEVALETALILPTAIVKQVGMTPFRLMSHVSDQVQKVFSGIGGSYDSLRGGKGGGKGANGDHGGEGHGHGHGR